MKKFISFSLIFLLCATFPFASANDVPPLISDEAGHLTSSEETKLQEKLQGIYDTYGVYAIVFTEEEMSGISAEDSAEDFYNYFFSGKDCIILYIADYDREYALSAFGKKGKDAFSDDELADVEDAILPHLKKDNFSDAIFAFTDEAENILDVYTNGSTGYKIAVISIAIILPFIIALIAMLVQLSKMKTAVKQHYATNYIRPGSMNISRSLNLFLYSVITKKPRPKPSNSSSGSSNSRSGKF
ncbi:MAG: TPM domain-containing protein [Oscillospiraceae bacterium]|nr:TPM domain-containing protein [Oscillospiraceae bacterium]